MNIVYKPPNQLPAKEISLRGTKEDPIKYRSARQFSGSPAPIRNRVPPDPATLRYFQRVVALHDGEIRRYVLLQPKKPRRLRQLGPKLKAPLDGADSEASEAEFKKIMNDIFLGIDEVSIRHNKALSNLRARLARDAEGARKAGGAFAPAIGIGPPSGAAPPSRINTTPSGDNIGYLPNGTTPKSKSRLVQKKKGFGDSLGSV